MEVFISWSGPKALAVARELHDVLPAIHNEIVPWVSDKDISAGSVWREEIRAALTRAAYAIICVTPDGLRSPWVHYEAGAIHEGFRKPVCPYLIGVDPSALRDLPIAHLQYVAADRNGTSKVLSALNQHAQRPVALKVLERAIAGQWGALEKVIAACANGSSPDAPEAPVADPVAIADSDAANMITAWIRGLTGRQATEVVVFAELDRQFRFPPGTTRRVFQRAAEDTVYCVEGATENTALLAVDMSVGVASDPPRGWGPSRDGFGGF